MRFLVFDSSPTCWQCSPLRWTASSVGFGELGSRSSIFTSSTLYQATQATGMSVPVLVYSPRVSLCRINYLFKCGICVNMSGVFNYQVLHT